MLCSHWSAVSSYSWNEAESPSHWGTPSFDFWTPAISVVSWKVKRSRPFLFRSLVSIQAQSYHPTGMVQQGQQRTEVPKSQRLEAMATSYPLTRQSGVLPSSNLFPRTSNDFEIQPWFGLYETSVPSLAYIYNNTYIYITIYIYIYIYILHIIYITLTWT